jgi:hypothetical protein
MEHKKRSDDMRLTKAVVVIIFFCCFIAGCETIPGRSPRDYLDYANSAVDRKDWEAAYRLMEDALVSDDFELRAEANDLVSKYPQIVDAARESFSVEKLEETYRLHGERAFEIERERLSVYKRSLATPQDYEQAIEHFHAVYDFRIRAAQERQELNMVECAEARQKQESEKSWRLQHDPVAALLEELYEVVDKGNIPSGSGNTAEMLESLKVDQTSRRDALAILGKPSRHFESATILTWFIRVQGEAYTVVPTQYGTGVTHSLVLVFSRAGTLSEKSFVRIVR